MAMKIRYTNKPEITGFSSRFNEHGLGEVIVGFDGGDMTSEFISELDVQLTSGRWLPMGQAFRDRLILGDNYDQRFAEADDGDRDRGWIK
jgi:hypothetical protein